MNRIGAASHLIVFKRKFCRVDKNLIIKFLQRECTSEEEKAVVEWMHSENFEPELLSHIENDLMNLEAKTNNEEDLQVLLQNIMLRDQMDQIDSGKQTVAFSQKKSGSAKWFLKIAATLLIALTLSYLINFFSRQVPADSQPVTKYTVKENGKGRMSTIALPDGSVVKLNAESKIKYQESFIDTSRIVYLEGEAFFEVAKDSLRPFIVLTDNISVTALGTSFNVSSYQEEDKIAVALASGKVVVKEKSQMNKVFLQPGQQVQYKKRTNQFTELNEFSAKSVYGWKDGVLYFKSATLPEVISRLERWFGVEFIIEGSSPLSWSYTGEFDNQSLKSVLESLSFSQNFNYRINDKTVTIDFNTE